MNGIQEVSGSIPLISTTRSLETLVFQGFFVPGFFIDRLDSGMILQFDEESSGGIVPLIILFLSISMGKPSQKRNFLF